MASGDTLIQFLPTDNEPPSAAFATVDTRNGHPVLDFDAATDESAIFSGVMPRNYNGSGVTVLLHVAFSSAVADEAHFDVAFERVGDGQQDIDSDGFAAAQPVDVTAPATSGFVEIASVPFTDGAEMDSIAVGELFRLKITRDPDHANDDATGDAELVAVEIRET